MFGIENEKIKLTTITISLVIFIAYFKQFLYYDYFGIDISDYIQISEVFTPFIDELVLWFLFIISYPIFIWLLFNIIKFIIPLILNFFSKYILKISKEKPKEVYIIDSKEEHFFTQGLYYLVGIMAAFSTTYIQFIYHEPSFIKIALYTNLPFWLAFIYVIIQDKIDNKKRNTEIFDSKNQNTHKLIFLSTVFFIITLIFVGFISIIEIQNKTKKEFKTVKYVFNLKNQYYPIKTDSLNIYIGRTYNNFFIYNLKDKKTTIYNTAEIQTQEVINLEK